MQTTTLTVMEMAQELRIGRVKAYELIHMQGFPVVFVGRRAIIPRDALMRWLEQEAAETNRA